MFLLGLMACGRQSSTCDPADILLWALPWCIKNVLVVHTLSCVVSHMWLTSHETTRHFIYSLNEKGNAPSHIYLQGSASLLDYQTTRDDQAQHTVVLNPPHVNLLVSRLHFKSFSNNLLFCGDCFVLVCLLAE